MTTGKRLHRLADLKDVHMGRQIQVEGLTGTLVGWFNVGDRVVVRLILGGCYAFTDALPGDTHCEIWREKD